MMVMMMMSRCWHMMVVVWHMRMHNSSILCGRRQDSGDGGVVTGIVARPIVIGLVFFVFGVVDDALFLKAGRHPTKANSIEFLFAFVRELALESSQFE